MYIHDIKRRCCRWCRLCGVVCALYINMILRMCIYTYVCIYACMYVCDKGRTVCTYVCTYARGAGSTPTSYSAAPSASSSPLLVVGFPLAYCSCVLFTLSSLSSIPAAIQAGSSGNDNGSRRRNRNAINGPWNQHTSYWRAVGCIVTVHETVALLL